MSLSPRDLRQQDFVSKYIASGLNQCTGVLSTGFGKSKVAIDIIKVLKPAKVYILVNGEHLRDKSWKKEFYKFDYGEFYEDNVTTVTYQTAHKWSPETHDLSEAFIIADEVDFAADVDVYSKFFYTYSDCKILGLTGFITESKKPWFAKHLPVFYTYTADEAQSDKVLNKLRFTFVKYNLSRNPSDITVTYKKAGKEKSFTQSENAAYEYAHKEFIKIVVSKQMLEKKMENCEISPDEYLKQSSRLDYLIKKTSSNRRELILKSKASQTMAKRLINYLTSQNINRKIVVFSKRNQQSVDILGINNVYNGLVPKKLLSTRFDDFDSGKIRVLGITDKINRGANINNLNSAIFESFFGSDTKATQRLGRMMRLNPEELGDVYIFLPYYIGSKNSTDNLGRKVKTYVSKPTIQVEWARSMLRSTNVKLSQVWDYRDVTTE